MLVAIENISQKLNLVQKFLILEWDEFRGDESLQEH